MEPGHEDREYLIDAVKERLAPLPQWSPVMKTGNTSEPLHCGVRVSEPQWSPVMKTGNSRPVMPSRTLNRQASMEPGHEDREYAAQRPPREACPAASMEPGHEDREYAGIRGHSDVMGQASMEPGHEDREYGSLASVPLATSVAHSCEDCHSAPPADGRERRQGRQEPALTRARALSGDPIGTRALARQSGILSWGAACGVRRT